MLTYSHYQYDMTDTDKKLYELLGDKTLSFGCYVFNEYKRVVKKVRGDEYLLNDGARYDLREGEKCIIGHEPTIADLHRVFASLKIRFEQDNNYIRTDDFLPTAIGYDCTRSLLSQSEETKLAIIELITSNS